MGTDFFTLKELAEKLEVSTKTIQRMVERCELKEGEDFYRIGRSLRFFKTVMARKYRIKTDDQ